MKISRSCKNCKKDFKVWKSQIKHRGGKFCSRSCGVSYRNKYVFNPSHNRSLKGENNPMYGKGHLVSGEKNGRYGKYGDKNYQWKGGEYKRSDGYIRVSVKGEKRLKHRVVMEEHLGRKLEDNEIIHHKNGKKDDNRIENLEITNRSKHAKIHHDETKGSFKSLAV